MTITKKFLKSRIEKYSSLLGIGDYKYFVNIVSKEKLPKDEYDIYGSVLVDDEAREACIQINKELLTESPDEIDRTLIHELLHVRFAEFLSMIGLFCKHYVKDRRAREVYLSQVNGQEHKIIVALTNAIVEGIK